MKKSLLKWYLENKRNLPWRNTTDAYKIWLSEIILQQTRVAQGLPYYLKFIEKFPTIQDLSQSKEQEVLKLWQGLGYYSRARNLYHTAKDIVENYEGIFPKTYKQLLQLKGVGDYTAAAIASFCYNEPVAVVDGNVYRVLSRYLGVQEPINSSSGKKIFKKLANQYLDKQNPGLYNQAIMEFGALQCTPLQPNCIKCPLIKNCVAYQTGKVRELPIKLAKIKIKKRYFHYIIIHYRKKIIWQKRATNDIWQNLYQPVLIEGIDKQTIPLGKLYNLYNEYLVNPKGKLKFLFHDTQQLTHQKLEITFWELQSKTLPKNSIALKEAKKYPMPVVVAKFLDNYNL